ncbi:NACHT domain protein [Aspergillus undulatus]|uniref:NACHT domain protein n=1 Tax=Aspergillus undulatus TaxID=1810928 RepID=UPI003CCE41C9
MAPSLMSPISTSADGIFRHKRISGSRRVSGFNDADSVASGAARSIPSLRMTSRNFRSAGTTNISSVVTSLQRRSGEELGTNASARLLTATHHSILEWIRSERMSLLPPEGSDYDKVLAWAQLFVDRLNSFDVAIEQFAGDSYLAAQLSYGYCAMLLELGRENASALMISFGFFYSISMALVNLLERTELFSVTQEIQEQLVLALSDLVTLVANVSTHFHQAIRGMTSASVSVNIYRTFSGQVQTFQQRCEKISESMWRHQLLRENLDGDKVSEVKAIKAWLAPEDRVVGSIADNSSHLAHDREELTCLWMGPYLTRFLKTQQKHLSITGQPGSGKSVLASVIIDHLQHPHGGVSYQTLFIPINGRIPAQTGSYAIARSILSQLFEKRIGNVPLFRILSEALRRSSVTADHEAYDTILWDTVEQALAASLKGAKELVLVVDGVDEATCGEEKLLQRLIGATAKSSNARLITLGSQTPPKIEGQSRVRITDDNIFDDIAAVVRGCFGHSHVFSSLPSIEQETVVERIAQASNSSFLRAKLITKRVRGESSPEKLRKALDSLLSTKPTVTDFVLHAVQQSDVSTEAKLMLSWLATAERPLHVQELATLASIQPDKHSLSESRVDPLHALKPLNSLVFLQYDYFFLRHGLIRSAVVDVFSQGKLIPSVKDRHTDLVTRLLVYIKTNVNENDEPSSLPALDYHDTVAFLDKYPLLDFALRYWVPTFRQTTVFTKDGEPTASKEISKVLPMSTTVVRLLRSVLHNVALPNLLTFQTSILNIYRTILTTDNVTTLQSIITLATLFRQVHHPGTFTLFYDAALLSQKLLTTRHIVTTQMTTIFLDLTNDSVTESKTDIMIKREELLLVLVECYKVHYGNTSQKVISVLQSLVEHYRKIKDTKNAEKITLNIQSLTAGDYGSSSGTSGGLDVRLVGRGDTSSDSGYLLRLDLDEEDDLVETTESYEVDALIRLAEKYLQSGRVDLAERTYVEFWQRATLESRVHSSALWEEKKMKVILAYTNFLRTQKREREASSVLTSFWQDYHHSSVSLSDSAAVHLQEIAKVMKSIGLSTAALNIFKQVSEYYHSTRRSESSSAKEVQQLLQTTSEEVMKSASSTSVVSESTLEEMILETSTTYSSVGQSFYSSTETLLGLYMSQRRWQHASRTIKQILRNTWAAFFATTVQDITLPHKHVDSSLALAERLAQCYHARHRLTKEQDSRLRVYYAVRSGLNVEDKLRQHHISELLRLLERTSQTDLRIDVYQELLHDYTKHYGSDHPTVIQTLRTLAELTRPRPIFLDYYQQIIQALNKGGKYHPDSLEPLDIVATELWNQGRYSDALHYCQILFTTWLNQPKLSPKFQDEKFVQGIFNRYIQSLRSVRTDYAAIHKVTLEFQTKCKTVFSATASITVHATLTLAQLCQESKHHEIEAIRLYEELLKINSTEVDLQEIRGTLDALYEEQSAILSNTQLAESASSAQIEQAVKVLRKRVTTLRESYGWAHEESLSRMREVISFYSKQNKTESVVHELQEVTVNILSTETSTTRLSEAAATIVSSYIATKQTQKAVELSDEVYRQVIRKDTTNVKSSKFDLTSKSRASLIFLAQLEHHLRRQSSTVTEILASLTTELVYFEDFRQHIQSSSHFLSASASAARLHYFLLTINREQVATEVTNEFITYFLANEGKRIGFKSAAEVKVFIMMVLSYFSTRQSQDIVRSIGIASNTHVLELIKLQKYDEACELALASFKYIAAQESYHTPAIARFVLALGMNISARGLHLNEAHRKKLLSTSAIIVQDVLKVLQGLKINLAQVGLAHLNDIIGLLGEQGNYQTLAAVLTAVWHSREAQRDWDPSITLSLGRLFIMVRYLVGDTTAAVRLAEDIVYNCRRVHGSRHPSTLQMSVLLSQLYTGVGQRYQSHKDGQELANRYYKRAAALHENILRALSDPTFDDLDGSMSADGSVLDLDDVNASFDAGNIDDQVRHHFKLFKLAIQRLGSWPKEYAEYERLNADLFREYPAALKGVEGTEKWDLKGFGAGKAESSEDLVDTEFKDWALFGDSKLVHANGLNGVNGVDGVEEEL